MQAARYGRAFWNGTITEISGILVIRFDGADRVPGAPPRVLAEPTPGVEPRLRKAAKAEARLAIPLVPRVFNPCIVPGHYLTPTIPNATLRPHGLENPCYSAPRNPFVGSNMAA